MTDKKTTKPESPLNELEDHSVSSGAAKTKGVGAVTTSKADAAAKMAEVPVTDAAAEKQSNTVADKIAKSGMMYHENQLSGHFFVGPIVEECATARCRHTNLQEIEPRAGLEVQRSEGSAFAIPSDFPRGLGPAGWLAVTDGDGKSLFA